MSPHGVGPSAVALLFQFKGCSEVSPPPKSVPDFPFSRTPSLAFHGSLCYSYHSTMHCNELITSMLLDCEVLQGRVYLLSISSPSTGHDTE